MNQRKRLSSDERQKKLDNIANSFRAAQKIQHVISGNPVRGDETPARALNMDMLNEILHIISQHSPEQYREPLKAACTQCSLVTGTYKDLKQHMEETRAARENREAGDYRNDGSDFTKALKIIKPITPQRQQTLIDKLLGIYDILKS